MIIVDDVYKRYQTEHGLGKWVLNGVTVTIPKNANVGLVGRNGAGKSTLMRLIGGIDRPSSGRIERNCRVSWPLGFSGGFLSSMTGRQNAKFICRIHGEEERIEDRLRFIQDFAEIGESFDEPVKNYSSGMRERLTFAISLAFDFDVYLSDEATATGDQIFKRKAKEAFDQKAGSAGLIMVSHDEEVLREFCTAGILLHEGRAQWFDSLDDALYAYKGAIRDERMANRKAASADSPLAGQVRRTDEAILGWAVNKATNEIVSVDVLVNGRVLLTREANAFRPRLQILGISDTGIGGFEIPLAELGVTAGESVHIVYSGTQKDLAGSPVRID